MGIGFDFGPPKRGFDPHAEWLGKRRLSAAHLAEMVRRVEARGYAVDERSDEKIIDADCEEFVFGPTGGHLSKPSRDFDEGERQLDLACRLCEYAGWILVGEGFSFGFEQRGDQYVALFSPPPDAPAPDLLDGVRKASTAAALEKALADLKDVPRDDPAILAALLLSRNDEVVADALDALDVLSPTLTNVLDARLRRLRLLSDDPAIAARAERLRSALR